MESPPPNPIGSFRVHLPVRASYSRAPGLQAARLGSAAAANSRGRRPSGFSRPLYQFILGEGGSRVRGCGGGRRPRRANPAVDIDAVSLHLSVTTRVAAVPAQGTRPDPPERVDAFETVVLGILCRTGPTLGPPCGRRRVGRSVSRGWLGSARARVEVSGFGTGTRCRWGLHQARLTSSRGAGDVRRGCCFAHSPMA